MPSNVRPPPMIYKSGRNVSLVGNPENAPPSTATPHKHTGGRCKWATRGNRTTTRTVQQDNRAIRTTWKSGKGDGAHLSQICKQRKMVPMNPWKRAPITKKRKQFKQTQNNTQTQQETRKKQLTHWISSGGKQKGKFNTSRLTIDGET